MCVALVGGIGRLKRLYLKEARSHGVDLRYFKGSCPDFDERLKGTKSIIVFTCMISHDAKRRAVLRGKASGIPVRLCHSCGLSSLRKCLEAIVSGGVH